MKRIKEDKTARDKIVTNEENLNNKRTKASSDVNTRVLFLCLMIFRIAFQSEYYELSIIWISSSTIKKHISL